MNDLKNTAIKEDVEKEYLMLREEIMYHQNLRDNMAQFSYTVCVAIYAAAITAGIAWINLCALIFLIPMSLKAAESANSMAYIASYVKTFLEDKCGYNWEKMHMQYYVSNPRRSPGALAIHYLSRWDFVMLTIISSTLFWVMMGINPFVNPVVKGSLVLGVIILIFQIIVFIFEIVVSMYYSNFGKRKKTMSDNWKKVIKDLDL